MAKHGTLGEFNQSIGNWKSYIERTQQHSGGALRDCSAFLLPHAVASYKQVAEHCNFKDTLYEMLCDRMVCSIANEK